MTIITYLFVFVNIIGEINIAGASIVESGNHIINNNILQMHAS